MGRFQVLVVGLTLLVPAGMPAAGFVEQLTPEERRAAGIDQMSPAQQAALDRLAERYAREGAREVSEEAKQEIRRQAKAEVRAEVRAEVKEEVKAEAAAKAVAEAGRPVAAETVAIRSRIVGRFNGWSGSTVFRLENGQTWMQTDSTDSYWVPAVENPEVEIRPSRMGGWKLYLLGTSAWVRVRRR